MRMLWLVPVCLTLMSFGVQAEPDPLHHAATPTTESSLTLHDVLEAAWKRAPDQPVVPALKAEAAAMKRRGDSFFAGPASVSAMYRGDQLSDDTGLREMDVGVSVPLWNPGQRSAAAGWSNAAEKDADLTRSALRLQLAGQVRDALWNLLMTEKHLTLATTDESEAKGLVALVEKQHRAGDVAKADLLLAQDYLLEKSTSRLRADAQVMDARRTYVALTGLNQRPARFIEKEVSAETLSNDHPMLARARARMERATKALTYARKDQGANPNLTLGVKRERADFASDSLNSAYVGISVPLGTGSSAAPVIAAAARELAQSQADYDNLLRTLNLNLHEAEHTLATDRATLDLNSQQADMASQRASMTERAYRLGETDIFNLVQARALAQRARLAAEQAALQVEWDIARFNQAAGETP